MLRTEIAICILLVVIGGCIGFMVGATHSAHADSPQEVAPYKLADIEGDVHIYKAVHQGCELFIVRGHAWDSSRADSVSIATGRGCK